METDRPHSARDVRRGSRGFRCSVHWRSRHIHADQPSAIPSTFCGPVRCPLEYRAKRMSTIEVGSPGLLTTVQDLGREGFGPMGVSSSGAADAIALRIGNRLVGNPENAAALEMTLLGGSFRFPAGAIVALTGSDFGASLGERAISPWTSIEVRAGQTVCIG